MGYITCENLRVVLNKRKLKFVRPNNTPGRTVTTEDITIAEEWFAGLPQSLLEDSDKPLITEQLFEIAKEHYVNLCQEDISALKQAAYDLMINRTYETLNTCIYNHAEKKHDKGRI